MKLFFYSLVFLFTSNLLFAQERTISGRLTSNEDGSSLPGIYITIKGTNIGTTTDIDGYYSIRVPIGATLVFSFIGMETREVVVTENNLQLTNSRNQQTNAKKKKNSIQPIPKSLYSDSTVKAEIGVAILTNESPIYISRSTVIDPATIRSIKQKGNIYYIKSDNDPVRRKGYAIQFSTSLSYEKINRLPSFQSMYAQGRSDGSNFQWRGADQLETFSWGPLVRTLEFDGVNYAYDKNGKLVPLGTGTGEMAKNYDAFSFFRAGMVNVNELMITIPVPKNGTLIFDLENRSRSGVIPNSNYRRINLSTSLKNFKLTEDLEANASLSFNRSAGDLLNRGANLSSVIGSVYRTPVTFDNTNSLSPTSARTANEAYEFSDGSKRSHAPGIGDNPNGLINDLPDNDELHRFMGTINLQYYPETPFSLVFNGSFDQQWSTTAFGTAPGYSGSLNGRLTKRKDDQTFSNAILTSAYSHDYDNGEFKLSLSYQAEYSARQLNRTDGFNFISNESFNNLYEADSVVALYKDLNRTSQEIIFNAQYEYYNWINVRFTNRSYFSNTVNYKQYSNFFPSVSVSFDIADIGNLWPFYNLKLYATLSRSLREAPLLYSNWSYGSTNIPVENYTGFYESNELFFTKALAPETERKFETGLRAHVGGFSAEFFYFNNLTNDFVAPVLNAGGFELQNAAAINNYGGAISASYNGYIYNGSWGIDLKWSKYNSLVQEINSSDDWIPLAGFQTIQSVIAPGKPLGAIYGTTYVRNPGAEKVIGSDGFPLEDNELKMIGNPVPDWLLGWSSFIQWKYFKFSFLFDIKKGGDIWNGTNGVLDYLGRSANTEDLRNTANYIFEGVDINNTPNTIPVNFYDPSNPISDNRWVRYGWDGVGEEYIEEASWIRLSELVLSYTTRLRGNNATIKEMKISLIGRNLFLITSYSGVDPSATLFGYSTGNGLDLFNTPSVLSFSAQITIKI